MCIILFEPLNRLASLMMSWLIMTCTEFKFWNIKSIWCFQKLSAWLKWKKDYTHKRDMRMSKSSTDSIIYAKCNLIGAYDFQENHLWATRLIKFQVKTTSNDHLAMQCDKKWLNIKCSRLPNEFYYDHGI